LKALVFVTDGFGNRGGIALFNQQMLRLLREHPLIEGVVVVPRSRAISDKIPPDYDYRLGASAGALPFLRETFKVLIRTAGVGLVVCGHINLLPAAGVAAILRRVPLLLMIHGVEGWKKPERLFTRIFVKRVQRVLAVSQVTRERFLSWSAMAPERVTVILNAVDMAAYGLGEKPGYLLRRYGLNRKKIILTMGRMEACEKAKGFDQVLQIMPDLVKEDPSIRYVLVGDGDDRARLQRRARELGLDSLAVFTGWVTEDEKADHFRLSDAYVMPSRMEGFGYVLVEAMACGVPVVGSRIDGAMDALDGGRLGQVVDPDDLEELKVAVHRALKLPKRIPEGLSRFSLDNYRRAFHSLIDELCVARI
jgi:glycosyltransferase involved in cell wall biosynthesis